MSPRLERAFFDRDTRVVARGLLGARLVRAAPDGARLSGRIVEAEAYREGDAASHSFRGRTPRNAPMFGPPGCAYVYFTYGMHFCMNIVSEREGFGAAVLLRAVEPEDGLDEMRRRRGAHVPVERLCRGPANLCKAFGLDRSWSGYDLCQADSALFVEAGERIPEALVCVTPRVGVRGDATALSAPWRWCVDGSPSVSGAPPRRASGPRL